MQRKSYGYSDMEFLKLKIMALHETKDALVGWTQIIESIKNKRIVKVWEYNSRFDLSDYNDGAWDEGNNCNSYKTWLLKK